MGIVTTYQVSSRSGQSGQAIVSRRSLNPTGNIQTLP